MKAAGLSAGTAAMTVTGLLALLLAGCAPLPALPPAPGPLPSAEAGATATPAAPPAASKGSPAPPAGAAGTGWQTYTDSDAGYSISLPPGAVWRSGKSRDGIYTARIQFQIPGVPGYQGMVIRVEPNPGGRGLEQILGEFYQEPLLKQPADLLVQTQPLIVAGANAVKVTARGEDFTVVVPYAGKTYFIAPVHDLPMSAVEPEALELFNQALATFAPAK